jgi:large subunit ribosomal protein L3
MASMGLIGRKCGMTRVFTDDGASIPVTVVEVLPNRITQIKNQEQDGYLAVQVTMGSRRASRVTKPLAGHFAKAGVEAGVGLWEFRVDSLDETNLGQEVTVDLFVENQWVDVAGVTRGKGFQGTIKRHHFTMGDATHGNSLSHRAPGSIGQRQTPGRVFKGKKMAGRMGNVQRTAPNLKVVRVDKARNLLLIQGAVPGAPGGIVRITPAVKKARTKQGGTQ